MHGIMNIKFFNSFRLIFKFLLPHICVIYLQINYFKYYSLDIYFHEIDPTGWPPFLQILLISSVYHIKVRGPVAQSV